jgi:hypothetical protein
MGPFNHSRQCRIGYRPQRRHRLHRRERQVIPGNCLAPRPRVFRELTRQLPSINRLSPMLGEEELTGHLSPHPRPVSRRDRGVGRPSDGGVERRDALSHLNPKRAQIVVDNLERRPQPRHVLKILSREVGSLQLLLPQLGQRMQTAAKQRSHLLRRHRVTGGKSVDPIQAGADPHPRGTRPVRCSTTPGLCDPSQSRPTPPPAGSSSHTQTRR